MLKQILYTAIIAFFIISCNDDPKIPLKNVYIESVTINGKNVSNGGSVFGMPVDSVVFQITFSSPIDKTKFDPEALFLSMGLDTGFVIAKDTFSRQLNFKISHPLNYYTSYTLYVAEGEQLGVNILDPHSFTFVTKLDPAPKFPVISDDSLLTLVQKQTFAYFWDHAHPTSGLARERYGSAETVTSGGSGFGIMTIPVAIERGFITRQQGFERLQTIVNFLNTKADRFHGAYPHWLNGTSGKTQPFSTKDNGADLVETAFLMQGLLTVQQYFKTGNSAEKAMCDTIQKIWEAVEWSWFQQNGQQKLFWHWSPNYNWEMNMAVSGWNEGLIVYVLAAASPTYPITKAVLFMISNCLLAKTEADLCSLHIILSLGSIPATFPTNMPIIWSRTSRTPVSIMLIVSPIPKAITVMVPIAGDSRPAIFLMATLLHHPTTIAERLLRRLRYPPSLILLKKVCGR